MVFRAYIVQHGHPPTNKGEKKKAWKARPLLSLHKSKKYGQTKINLQGSEVRSMDIF